MWGTAYSWRRRTEGRLVYSRLLMERRVGDVDEACRGRRGMKEGS